MGRSCTQRCIPGKFGRIGCIPGLGLRSFGIAGLFGTFAAVWRIAGTAACCMAVLPAGLGLCQLHVPLVLGFVVPAGHVGLAGPHFVGHVDWRKRTVHRTEQ